MKKIVLGVLVFVSFLMLCACSGGEADNKKGSEGNTTQGNVTQGGVDDSSAVKLFDETGNNENGIHIGDYVAYNEGVVTGKDTKGNDVALSDGTMKWRVLGVEDGKLKLIAENSIQGLTSMGFDETIKNCELFGKGNGADSARSIADKDFETVATINPKSRNINDCADITNPLFDVFFKDGDGFYKTFAFTSDIDFDKNEKFSTFYCVCDWSVVLCEFNSWKETGCLPIIYLKSDVRFDGKDESGAWKIAGAEKTYAKPVYNEIASADDLMKLTEDSADMKANYILTNDIDLSGIENFPMITGNFEGTFDGNGHKITGLKIKSNAFYVGLFAQTTNAFIKDLTIENAEIVCEGFQEYGVDAGIMIGNSNTTRIMNCNISGNVSKDNETEDIHSHFGLMMGDGYKVTIFESNVSGTVTLKNEGDTGGFAGCLQGGSWIEKCFANVKFDLDSIHNAGGIVGDAFNFYSAQSGATCDIKANSAELIGGFATIEDNTETYMCYAKTNIEYYGPKAYLAGFVASIDYPLKAHNCYCSGNIKTVLPEGSKEYQDSYYFAFADNFRDVNCYSNMTTETQYPCKGKLTFFDGTLLYNSDYFSNSVWDDYKNEGVLVGVSTADFKNKDTYKEFDFETKWKWNEEKSCPELIFE